MKLQKQKFQKSTQEKRVDIPKSKFRISDELRTIGYVYSIPKGSIVLVDLVEFDFDKNTYVYDIHRKYGNCEHFFKIEEKLLDLPYFDVIFVEESTTDSTQKPKSAYLYDKHNRLICSPYSIQGLHDMASEFDIGRSFFKRTHYTIPKRKFDMIKESAELIGVRKFNTIIKESITQ